jgi:hypothetical protein
MTFTKEEARIKIQSLVEDFRAHEADLVFRHDGEGLARL